METYTILQYILDDNDINTIPMGFFVNEKDRDNALTKNFFFTNDDRLPSKESLQINRWAKKGIIYM